MSSATAENEAAFRGWTSSPDGRGTWDILISCLQFSGTHPEWTLSHAFFADMGGFVLEAADLKHPIPVDAKQMFYLVQRGLITVGQATWFVANCIARAVQGVHVTTIELTTLSFVVVTLATSYLWYHKPADVSSPIKLRCKASDPAARTRHYRTPLDFISRDEYVFSLLWQYYNDILRRLRMPLFMRPMTAEPWDRIPSAVWLRHTNLVTEALCGVVILVFGAIFFAAWNSPFPTETERTIWRAASVYGMVFCVVGGGYTWAWHVLFFTRWRQNRPLLVRGGPRVRKTAADWLRNLSPDNDPHLDMPLGLLLPVSLFCALYVVCRVYILIEDLIGLRALPPSAFETVSWSKFLPHI
ncbi:hypothetical protein CPLU01_09825 [Colletotrichum plurivorum]|uniref:Uncharacterized protein n=1 Tax=Colletotrichum plurivorum TaxID=2175906 RepID=A0A8H6K7F1_9PEZI|nr:hypothetical protein CPLU01_09825 [Colletotrichum plurivorum]